jgi:hypothetical protein
MVREEEMGLRYGVGSVLEGDGCGGFWAFFALGGFLSILADAGNQCGNIFHGSLYLVRAAV